MTSFDLSLINPVLGFLERGVTSTESFLMLKLEEIEDAHHASFEQGERG